MLRKYTLETKLIIWQSLIGSIFYYSKIIFSEGNHKVQEEMEKIYIRSLKITLGIAINVSTEKIKNILNIKTL
jgi:hypothetical protein